MLAAFYRPDDGTIVQRASGSPTALTKAAGDAGLAVIEIDRLAYGADPAIEASHRVVGGALEAIE